MLQIVNSNHIFLQHISKGWFTHQNSGTAICRSCRLSAVFCRELRRSLRSWRGDTERIQSTD